MEAKNFRIGNLVKSKQWHGVGAIQGIELTSDGFELKVKGYIHKFVNGKYFDLEPIELTEDWVKKLGFDDSDYRDGYTGIDSTSTNGMTTDFVITKPKFMGEWQTYYAFDLPSHRFSTINYVHELQNLFNIITGHELEYKEIQ